MVLKICRWCGIEFEAKYNREMYCDEHKEIAKKDKTAKRRLEYYKRNKRKITTEQLGTGSLGPHLIKNQIVTYLGGNIPFTDFIDEGKLIHKNSCNSQSVTRISKSNNTFIDYSGTIEYGTTQPLGLQNTHKGATFDDYVNMDITYKLQNRPECPECGSTIHIKNLKHINISCAECGLVLESGEGLMATTHTDKINSTNQRDLQDIGWKMYWIQQAFLDNKFKEVKP